MVEILLLTQWIEFRKVRRKDADSGNQAVAAVLTLKGTFGRLHSFEIEAEWP
jgi:hypothetical protein